MIRVAPVPTKRSTRIVNLLDAALEVRRDPGRLAPRGRGYRSIETLRPPAVIAPLARPDARIAVADVLP